MRFYLKAWKNQGVKQSQKIQNYYFKSCPFPEVKVKLEVFFFFCTENDNLL